MRLSNLDLNLLVYLDVLLEEQSVSKAAERVFISQPAMSDALARLRVHYKDQLLAQAGKRMVLTPLARTLVEPVRDILRQIQVTTSVTEFDPASSMRHIRIMASDFTISVLFPQVMQRLFQQAPHIKLEFLLTKGSREEIDPRQVDFVVTPPGYLPEDHPSELLFEETFTCVAWSKNNLVGNKLSMDQFFELGHAGVVLDGHLITYFDRFLKRYDNRPRKVEVVVPSFGMIFPAVFGTNRIAIVFRRYAEIFAPLYSLKLIELPFKIPPLQERIYWHKYMDCDPVLIWFRKLISSVASEIFVSDPGFNSSK